MLGFTYMAVEQQGTWTHVRFASLGSHPANGPWTHMLGYIPTVLIKMRGITGHGSTIIIIYTLFQSEGLPDRRILSNDHG